MNGDASLMPKKSTKTYTTVKKEDRDAIVAQALDELSFARKFKKGKMANWQLNEDLYYSKLQKTDDARANVDLAQTQEFVHTLLSKIDTPLSFSFTKRKNSQIQRVEQLNAFKEYDADIGFWDLKDVAGKKQMIIYGRAIFSYFADSTNGVYKSHNNNVDVYNFLIDPSAGGLDLEDADYLGDYGVTYSRHELENGKGFIRSEVKTLLMGENGNATQDTDEKQRQHNRTRRAQSASTVQKEKTSNDKFIFWRWGTTYKGQRYYLLLSEEGGCAVKVIKADEMFGSGRWWYWSYAAYPDLTEFWTPSPCDYIREILMAQAVSINQMLDNAEQVNKPQRIVDTSAVQDLAAVKYRKNGIIKAKAGLADKAIKLLETPSINTPIQVFNVLEQIKQRASGVTDAAKGMEDTDGRATIYEGNVEAANDRFRLFSRSYTHAYKHFARLYEWGLRDHLIRKTAIDVLGPEGVQLVGVSRRDLFKKKTDDEYGIRVESTSADVLRSADEKRLQVAFLGKLIGNPIVDQKDLLMQLGELSAVDTQVMHQLLDKAEFGDAESRGEAERDIERLLDGEDVKPNKNADTGYIRVIVDYLYDNGENLSSAQNATLIQYIRDTQPVVTRNMVEKARRDIAAERAAMAATGQTGNPSSGGVRAPGPSQPLQDVLDQNVQQ